MDRDDVFLITPLLPGNPNLAMYAIGRGPRNEVIEAIEGLRRSAPQEAADLFQRFLVIAVNYPNVPSSYLKPMAGYAGIWEVRFRRHRFFGFMVAGRRLYLCRYDYKNQQKADREKLESTAKLFEEWSQAHE